MHKPKPIATIAGLTLLCLIPLGLFLAHRKGHSASSSERTTNSERIGPELGVSAQDNQDPERYACEQKLADILNQPELPGAPKFDQNRVELLFHAKAEPVLFVKAPEYDAEEVTPMVKTYRRLLATSSHPWDAVDLTVKNFHGLPGYVRQTLLKDGYLYADDPALGFALVNLVSPQDLFGHEQIWVERGDKTYHAQRRNGKYYYSDGPSVGEPVHLLLLDRIGASFPDSPPLHRDLRSLRYRLHFDHMQIRRLTDHHIIADLQYGSASVPTVLTTEGARVSLECEIVDAAALPQVTAVREKETRRQHVVQVLRQSMLAEIADGLPFDEPRHEYGFQLDGNLRHNWRAAYFGKRPTFNYNGDRYATFDGRGHPHVPQVCVDFITDTIERASGTWYRNRGETPGKTSGGFDFGTELDKDWLRRAPEFVTYVSAHENWFDVKNAPKAEQTPLRDRDGLIDYLKTHSAEYQPGDIVMIKGYTPWDRRHVHYHSFFVYESDPISGIPIAIVGNAGRPSVRAWEVEARRTPKRTIQHRLRPNLEWLESIFKDRLGQVDDEPMSLSPAGSVD